MYLKLDKRLFEKIQKITDTDYKHIDLTLTVMIESEDVKNMIEKLFIAYITKESEFDIYKSTNSNNGNIL